MPRVALAPLEGCDTDGEDEEQEGARGELRTILLVMVVLRLEDTANRVSGDDGLGHMTSRTRCGVMCQE